jgi:hypothetical protein
MCRLIAFSAPIGPPYYANGSSRAVVNCEEHSWQDFIPVDGLCPIGRIEKAVEDGLAKLTAGAS